MRPLAKTKPSVFCECGHRRTSHVDGLELRIDKDVYDRGCLFCDCQRFEAAQRTQNITTGLYEAARNRKSLGARPEA